MLHFLDIVKTSIVFLEWFYYFIDLRRRSFEDYSQLRLNIFSQDNSKTPPNAQPKTHGMIYW